LQQYKPLHAYSLIARSFLSLEEAGNAESALKTPQLWSVTCADRPASIDDVGPSPDLFPNPLQSIVGSNRSD
jgi:hypothetical protein